MHIFLSPDVVFWKLQYKIDVESDYLFVWVRVGGGILGQWYKTFTVSENISCAIWGWPAWLVYTPFVPELEKMGENLLMKMVSMHNLGKDFSIESDKFLI